MQIPRARTPYLVFIAVIIILSATLAYGWYRYRALQVAHMDLRTTHTMLEALNGELTARVSTLTAELASSTTLVADLQRALEAQQQEKAALGGQLQTLSTTVGQLDKLSKTDKELLAKYSSVYFLNENYTPTRLVNIPSHLLSRPAEDEFIIAGASHHLTDLLTAASSSGAQLRVFSAYRSFDTQAALKSGYKITYGAGTANAFSADQGYSEHQLGTTVDFTSLSAGPTLLGFEETPSYQWLLEHAHEYGFVLSYPKNNGHFIYEPWHWRFVGTALSKRLHDEGKHFYEIDQREINTYLVSLFD